jgi:hypothetical protein
MGCAQRGGQGHGEVDKDSEDRSNNEESGRMTIALL